MKKIAVIGSGISGLVCSWVLQRKHQVTLLEARDYLGGHTHTVDVESDGKSYAIDTGFIVYNDRTYPNFIKFLQQLGVSSSKTEMGFSVSSPSFEMGYGGSFLDFVIAQKWHLLNPSRYKLIYEILRFNDLCLKLEAEGKIPYDLDIDSFLKKNGFSQKFRNHYLLPMISAIWSSSYNESAGFSLYFFIKFFSHHGLLSVNNRPQWYVIQKGSREYVSALMAQADFEVRLNSPVKSVRRNSDSVEVSTLDRTETYDEVIFACHSDQALKILSDASDLEKEILGALPYQENQVTLHTDISRLPKNKRNWASWNYMIEQPTDMESAQVKVSYNMNILQGIQSPKTFVVSLNQDELIDPKKILRQFKYWHPVFSKESEQYKARRDEISGVNRTYFCGAYWHSGFHEDGVVSALAVLSKLGMTL
ncbi:MAG: FAD-dependent oxidoreductase [Bdellovibrionales bacterium]|nr:FAD-dependent oxidoreductase [Bdellovibrionales bacterium]